MPVVCKRLLIATVVVFLCQLFFTRPAEHSDFEHSDFEHSDILQQLEGMGTQIDELPPEMFEQYTIEPDQFAMEMVPWSPRISIVEQWCRLDPEELKRGQLWRLVTYAFCHDRYGVWHLLINMLFLYWFGTRLEQMYGSKEFCLFYFASAVVAGAAFLALDYYTGSPARAIGASGAVWGLVALYVVHHPYERINIYGLFPIEIRWLALFYLVFDLHPVLLALSGDGFVAGGGVAHAAHVGGAAFGFVYFYRSWRLSRLWDRLTQRTSGGKWQSRTVRRPQRNIIPISRVDDGQDQRIDPSRKRLEADLDQVLEKIQTDGRQSLSDDEIAILEQASKHFRDR